MKTCSERWQEALLDHAAGAPVSMELARHLAGCTVCSAALLHSQRRMAAIDTGLHRLAAAEPSPLAVSRAIAAVRVHKRRAHPMHWQRAAALALAAMLIVSLGYVFRTQQQQRQALTAAAELNSWRSPTEGLLQSSPDPWLTTSPRVGEYFYPLDSQPNKKERKTP